mmetsp:Transcript_18691/g.51141  ORF Transcript_18691/g.51141 Transcript_18691/m.51141 type:complete len:285 (+) Transcript_18691:111-965(+)
MTSTESSFFVAGGDKPRRPLSAYNLFFKDQRQELKASAASQGQKSLGFSNLAKTIAAKWNALDATSKKPYEGLARVEKMAYKKAMAEWKKEMRLRKKTLAQKAIPRVCSSNSGFVPASAPAPSQTVAAAPVPQTIVTIPEAVSVHNSLEDDSASYWQENQFGLSTLEQPGPTFTNSFEMTTTMMMPQADQQQQQPPRDSSLTSFLRQSRGSSTQRSQQHMMQEEDSHSSNEGVARLPAAFVSSSSSWNNNNSNCQETLERRNMNSLANRLEPDCVSFLVDLFQE